MEIKKVGVVGCGLMGHGIAQVTAQAGYDVVVREIDQGALDRGLGKVDKQLARAVERGKLEPADAEATRGRIQGTLDYSGLAGSDLVVEAITEGLDVKREMWREVEAVSAPEAVFATNTSSIAVIDQAVVTGRPERFLGLHFFNPPQVMKLVEVVRSVTTSEEAFEIGRRFADSLGKLAIPTKDKAGFIVNRLLVPYMLDAIRAYEEGVGTIDEIDQAMKAARATRWVRSRWPTSSGSTRSAPSATCCSTNSASAASPARPRFARCSRRAGTGASPGAASTTTRATLPWRSSCASGLPGLTPPGETAAQAAPRRPNYVMSR